VEILGNLFGFKIYLVSIRLALCPWKNRGCYLVSDDDYIHECRKEKLVLQLAVRCVWIKDDSFLLIAWLGFLPKAPLMERDERARDRSKG
jgi:hypothetical protein